GGPGLQDRILGVHDGDRELAVAEQASVLDLAVIGIGGIGLHRPVARTRRRIELIVPEIHVPGEFAPAELRDGIPRWRGPPILDRGDKRDRRQSCACEEPSHATTPASAQRLMRRYPRAAL